VVPSGRLISRHRHQRIFAANAIVHFVLVERVEQPLAIGDDLVLDAGGRCQVKSDGVHTVRDGLHEDAAGGPAGHVAG